MSLLRTVIIAAVAALLSCAPARALVVQQYNIYNWYWVAQDTSPGAQVFSSASGTYVANNNATYLTWLAGGSDNSNAITAAANNGSGLVRLTLSAGTGNYTTNQFWNVSGTGLYDQNWQITVIDATHIDLQTSTFTAGVSTGIVSGPSVVPFGVNINALIDLFNQTLAVPGFGQFSSSTPPWPLAQFNSFAGASPITLAQADVPGAPPIGRCTVINNNTGGPVLLQAFGGGAITTIPTAQHVCVRLTANGGTTGTWSLEFPPIAAPMGLVLLNAASASNQATLQDLSSFSATYDDYLITFSNIVPVTNAVNFNCQLHSAGSFQATGYLNNAGGATTYFDMMAGAATLGNTAGAGYNTELWIHGVNGSNYKIIGARDASFFTNGSIAAQANSTGMWTGVGIVDGIQCQMSGGNVSTGSMKTYGLRGKL